MGSLLKINVLTLCNILISCNKVFHSGSYKGYYVNYLGRVLTCGNEAEALV